MASQRLLIASARPSLLLLRSSLLPRAVPLAGRRGLSTSSSGTSSSAGSASRGSIGPTAGLGGTRGGKGGLASIFDRSLKQHYQSNKPALDRIALSFLFFYCTGHMFMQKQKNTELEEELALLRREKKGLEASLKDEAWAKDVAKQLGVRDAGRLLAALALRIKENAGELTREDMAMPTTSMGGAAAAGTAGAAVAGGGKGNAMF